MANDDPSAVPAGDPAAIDSDRTPHAKPREMVRFQQVEMAGPLPPASEFGKYEQILKGAAERILAMAEKEQQHRHTLTEKHSLIAIEARADESQHVKRGQVFGLIVSLSAIGAGALTSIIASIHGSVAGAIAGGIVGAGGLASVILAFLGKRSETARAKKDDAA